MFSGRDTFPVTTSVNLDGHIAIGGCDLKDLVSEYGSPLYVYDETTIRETARDFVKSFRGAYKDSHISYSSKAFANPVLEKILDEEGIGIDIVSGGELAVAKMVEFPASMMNFNGNNKSRQELSEAVEYGLARITIDSFPEIDVLNEIAGEQGVTQPVLIRVSPSVDAQTHRLTTTGILDSKFGFSIETGHAEIAVQKVQEAKNLDLRGLHFHLGSPLFELDPYTEAIPYVMQFAADMRDKFGLDLREFSPGGGFAIGYVGEKLPLPISDYANAIADSVRAGCDAHGFDEPLLIVEPGRSMVGRSGVAIYTVGAIKEIPGVRTYVSVDGGMGDNIRPAIYDAEYEAHSVNRVNEELDGPFRIAGKFCESGDILVKNAFLPTPEPGDLIALPASGAYNVPMASNYNMVPRPAIVMVSDGEHRLIRRRETYEDLLRTSII
ncbi:MAG: diaminopimelate decarboxylase [Chloroflexi bacterium]|nr:diaminopimelate decarboxylase [Chloroflexota bacterium]